MKRYRSAVTGFFTTRKAAKADPQHHVAEDIRPPGPRASSKSASEHYRDGFEDAIEFVKLQLTNPPHPSALQVIKEAENQARLLGYPLEHRGL